MSSAKGEHFYLSGEVMQSWVGWVSFGFFFYIQVLSRLLAQGTVSSENMLTRWKRNIQKNLGDHLPLVISALIKTESFLVHSFHTVVQFISQEWNICKKISNYQLFPTSTQNFTQRERGKKGKSYASEICSFGMGSSLRWGVKRKMEMKPENKLVRRGARCKTESLRNFIMLIFMYSYFTHPKLTQGRHKACARTTRV